MSYKITYGPVTRNTLRRHRVVRGTAVLLVVATAVLLAFAFPAQAQRLKEFLFPWPQEAVAAFSAELENGKDLNAAVRSFCHVILSDVSVQYE